VCLRGPGKYSKKGQVGPFFHREKRCKKLPFFHRVRFRGLGVKG